MTDIPETACANRLTTIPLLLLLTTALFTSCSRKTDTGEDGKVTTLGSIEVTAQLVEIRGRLLNDPLYDYAHVMKYKVLQVHRGNVDKDIIYVGHYNPAKPRDKVADARVQEIGGNLKKFRAGDIHRMALEIPIDDYYMGGIINKYFQESKDPIYWALWTNKVINPDFPYLSAAGGLVRRLSGGFIHLRRIKVTHLILI